jgi:cardiolipin synthase
LRGVLSVPNALSVLRLIIVPGLWPAALGGRVTVVAIGLAIAGATDVLDGFIARSTGQRTRLGGQLDSVADLLLMTSTLAWLVLLRPQILQRHWVVLSLWIAFGVLALAVGWIRLHRVGNLHLISAKTAGTLAYAFVIYVLLFEDYSRLVFYAVAVACFVAVAETLLMFVLLPSTGSRQNPGSVLPLIRAALQRSRASRSPDR